MKKRRKKKRGRAARRFSLSFKKKKNAPVSRFHTFSSSASSHISRTSSSSGSESAVTGAEGGSSGRERARQGATARADDGDDGDNGDRTNEDEEKVGVDKADEGFVFFFPPIDGRQGTAREVALERMPLSDADGRLERALTIISRTIQGASSGRKSRERRSCFSSKRR